MQKILLVLAVLACAGDARQLPASDSRSQEVFKNLLLTLNPEAAFKPSPPGMPQSRSHLSPATMRRSQDAFKLSKSMATAASAAILASIALHPDAAQAQWRYAGITAGMCRAFGNAGLEYCEPEPVWQNALSYFGMIAVPFGLPIAFFIQGFFSGDTDISEEIEEARRSGEID